MGKTGEFCLVVYGDFGNIEEAKNALQMPFIEDYVEEYGKFRQNDFDNIRVAKGISLGELEIAQIDADKFEISCTNSHKPLNRTRIDELSELLDVYDIFDEVEIKSIG